MYAGPTLAQRASSLRFDCAVADKASRTAGSLAHLACLQDYLIFGMAWQLGHSRSTHT